MKVDGIELKKKSDVYLINPTELVVNFDENPRKEYGNTEEWNEFKSQIKMGLENDSIPPLRVQRMENGKLKLTHGFRRTKAFLELINEGVDVGDVRIQVVKKDATKEDIIMEHIFLNSGKNFTPIEMGDIIHRLKEEFGYNQTEVAEKLKISTHKVHYYLKFRENASDEVKKQVAKGEMSFSAAIALVHKNSKTDQNDILKAVKAKGKQATVKDFYEPKNENKSFADNKPTDAMKHATIIAIEEILQELGHDVEIPLESGDKFVSKLNEYGYNITNYKG